MGKLISTPANEVGQYIRFNSCQRRFKLSINSHKEARSIPFYDQLLKSLDPVLQYVGQLNEIKWEKALEKDHGFKKIKVDSIYIKWQEFLNLLGTVEVGQNVFFREVEISGAIGVFEISARIDFIILTWKNGNPIIRIVEIKASRKDKTYHRIQLAMYYQLIMANLSDMQSSLGNKSILIEKVVGRINEEDNSLQNIFELADFNLDIELEDVLVLLSESGELDTVLSKDLLDLPFELNHKCDECAFNTHCFAESARLRAIELLGCKNNVSKVLRNNDIKTVDALANLNLESSSSLKIQSDPDFNSNLDHLTQRAKARLANLPGDDEFKNAVISLTGVSQETSQLPPYIIGDHRLVRVYMSVEFDYTENRVIGLAAHISRSNNNIHTPFKKNEQDKWFPDPKVCEINEDKSKLIPLSGKDIVFYQNSPWSGDFKIDSGRESSMLSEFFGEIINSIAELVNEDVAPIHFYVWSRQEMTDLIDACTRAGRQMLSNFQELLGCRLGLDQLIFSSLEDEVNNRFATGWTSTGMSVAASLGWYGDTFHWNRVIRNKEEKLDQVFTQGIFDFKTDLRLKENGNWLPNSEEVNYSKSELINMTHKFEIRSRFNDYIPMPYWYALWRKFGDIDTSFMNSSVKKDIARYNESAKPLILKRFIVSRTHCLRWIEEKIKFKNDELKKPLLKINELPDFSLGVHNVVKSSLDFLRLEHHVKVNDWITSQFDSIPSRVSSGRTLVLKNLEKTLSGSFTADIVHKQIGFSLKELSRRCTLGNFVRLTGLHEVKGRQSFKMLTRFGGTFVVESVSWTEGKIFLNPIGGGERRYIFVSVPNICEQIDFATIDESVSDFVYSRIDSQLEALLKGSWNQKVIKWFDPTQPEIDALPTIDQELLTNSEMILSNIEFSGSEGTHNLSIDQKEAILQSLKARVFLLQGPPGTGKTQTTAVTVHMKVANSEKVNPIVVVSANTHTAVDTLLLRIESLSNNFARAVSKSGSEYNTPAVFKVDSDDEKHETVLAEGSNIQVIKAKGVTRILNKANENSPIIIGSTTSTMLKLANQIGKTFNNSLGFLADSLIIDEASMLVFPAFLSLSSLLDEKGTIVLAGDNRQLSPILSHDWEEEDRPPIELYQPFMSAYDSISNLSQYDYVTQEKVSIAKLNTTFRLPNPVRQLIQTVYHQDNISLTGKVSKAKKQNNVTAEDFSSVWHDDEGIYLVVHKESSSRLSNEFEAKIIQKIIDAGSEIVNEGVAIITPHRAQRTLLNELLMDDNDCITLIDTVERLQGNEERNILYSGTESDPSSISSNAEFILDLNRSNVAFSRSKERLIVVCSSNLINHIPADIDNYQSASLWKSLRRQCSFLLESLIIDGIHVGIYTNEHKE